jgi:hypothetical protein
MDELSTGQLVALVIPIVLVDLGLKAFAIRDLVRTDRVDDDRKWLWGVVVLFFNLLGPLLYFLIGRREG